jgi:hypothetical protein
MFKYLRDTGMNSVGMLLFNVGGDDKNVFPHLLKVNSAEYSAMAPEMQWTDGVHNDRYDVSKLAQWQRALSYADSLGLQLHFRLQEVENNDFMDGGQLGANDEFTFERCWHDSTTFLPSGGRFVAFGN